MKKLPKKIKLKLDDKICKETEKFITNRQKYREKTKNISVGEY